MGKQQCIITVENPGTIDNGPIDGLFSRSCAISDAVSKFWEMGLASKAELGKVAKTDSGYNVEIIYNKRRRI